MRIYSCLTSRRSVLTSFETSKFSLNFSGTVILYPAPRSCLYQKPRFFSIDTPVSPCSNTVAIRNLPKARFPPGEFVRANRLFPLSASLNTSAKAMATKHLYAEQFRPDRDIDNILKELEVTINYIEWTTCIYINYMSATLGQHLNNPATHPVFILYS
jgi:hypothetical protein